MAVLGEQVTAASGGPPAGNHVMVPALAAAVDGVSATGSATSLGATPNWGPILPGAQGANVTAEPTAIAKTGWILGSSNGAISSITRIDPGTWSFTISIFPNTAGTAPFAVGIRAYQVSANLGTSTVIPLSTPTGGSAGANGWVYSPSQTPNLGGTMTYTFNMASVAAVTFAGATPYLYIELVQKFSANDTVGTNYRTNTFSLTIPATSVSRTASDNLTVSGIGSVPVLRVSAHDNSPNSNVNSVTIPASVEVGDFLLFVHGSKSASTTVTPSGWTAIGASVPPNDGSSSTFVLCAFWKIATSADTGGSATVTANCASGVYELILEAWTGVSATSPINATASTSDTVAGTAVTSASVTTTSANCRVTQFWGSGVSATNTGFSALPNTIDSPSGVANDNGLATWAAAATSQSQAVAGASPVQSATTQPAATWTVYTIALAPVSGGALSMDSVSRQVINTRLTTDTIPTLSETTTRVSQKTRVQADTLPTLTETVARMAITSRPIADTLPSISETITRKGIVSRPVSDVLPVLTESLSRVIQTYRATLDSLPVLSENLARVEQLARATSDVLPTLSETIARNGIVSRPVSDTLPVLTDSAGRQESLNRNTTDNLATGGGGSTTIVTPIFVFDD